MIYDPPLIGLQWILPVFFRGCFIDLSGFSCGFTWIETQRDVDCFHVAGIQPIFLDAPSRMPDHLKS